MTYEEIKNKLSICEKALNSLKTTGYKKATKEETKLKIQEISVLKEGLEKRLLEADAGTVRTDDEAKAEKLAKKGVNVQLTEEDEGVQFDQNQTAQAAVIVGKATAKALVAAGEELASMKVIRIQPNSFDVKAVFKGEKGEDEYSFYISNNKLNIADLNSNKEIADVGVQPSGGPLVNGDIVSNELQKHFRSLSEEGRPLGEGEGDDHHYLKVSRRDYKKAQAILDKNVDPTYVKVEVVDNDGAGNVIFYFVLRHEQGFDDMYGDAEADSEFYQEPEEDGEAFVYDAVMDLQANDINVVDHSAEDLNELDANDPVLMRLRAKAMEKKKNSKRSNFDPRGIDQEEAMDLRMRLKDLEEEREDILRNMEQEAEPEGGPIADDYGSILNDIDAKIYKVKKQIHQYDMNESPMTMAYTKIVKPKKTNEQSVDRIQKAYDVLIDNMKELGKKYNAGDKSLIGQLKNLTKQKKYLEKSLQDKVANIGKNQKLDELLSVDKQDALEELREILGRVEDYGEQAREVIRQEFPNYLSKGDSYGVFNMGSSANRYDTTLESMIDGIERHYSEEEDEVDEGKYKSDAQRKAIHATKAEKNENVTQKHIEDIEASGNIDIAYKKAIELLKSMIVKNENIKEGRGDLDQIVRVITDMANEDGTSTKEAALEIIDAIKDAYQIHEKGVQENYNKESLLKALGDADDAMIQLSNGRSFIIYNPNNNNDDNAAMWHDTSVFAVDKDGGEHEIDYKDISGINLEEADLGKGEKKQVKKIVGQLKKSVKGHGDQAKYLSKLVKEGTELYDDNNFQFKRFAAGQGNKALQVTARKLGGGGFDYIQIPGDKVRLFAQAAVKSASLFNDMKYQGADADTLESAPGYKHDCAAKVVHEKYGPGNCIHGQHTLVKEGAKHVVTHYDVFFKKDNKTVKDIPVNELKIVTMNEHWHKNYKKKSK